MFLAGFLLYGSACSDEDNKSIQIDFVGTWIEKNPEMFDGISDTIVFTGDLMVEKHFYYIDWNYSISKDSILFCNDSISDSYQYITVSDTEFVLNNFLDRLVTSQVKDIHFIKIQP